MADTSNASEKRENVVVNGKKLLKTTTTGTAVSQTRSGVNYDTYFGVQKRLFLRHRRVGSNLKLTTAGTAHRPAMYPFEIGVTVQPTFDSLVFGPKRNWEFRYESGSPGEIKLVGENGTERAVITDTDTTLDLSSPPVVSDLQMGGAGASFEYNSTKSSVEALQAGSPIMSETPDASTVNETWLPFKSLNLGQNGEITLSYNKYSSDNTKPAQIEIKDNTDTVIGSVSNDDINDSNTNINFEVAIDSFQLSATDEDGSGNSLSVTFGFDHDISLARENGLQLPDGKPYTLETVDPPTISELTFGPMGNWKLTHDSAAETLTLNSETDRDVIVINNADVALDLSTKLQFSSLSLAVTKDTEFNNISEFTFSYDKDNDLIELLDVDDERVTSGTSTEVDYDQIKPLGVSELVLGDPNNDTLTLEYNATSVPELRVLGSGGSVIDSVSEYDIEWGSTKIDLDSPPLYDGVSMERTVLDDTGSEVIETTALNVLPGTPELTALAYEDGELKSTSTIIS